MHVEYPVQAGSRSPGPGAGPVEINGAKKEVVRVSVRTVTETPRSPYSNLYIPFSFIGIIEKIPKDG